MLARRFTIVCLITALFGLFFALLVAEASGAPTATVASPCLALRAFYLHPPREATTNRINPRSTAMNRSLTSVLNVLRHLPRAVAIMLVLLEPPVRDQKRSRRHRGTTIEAPTPKKSGMGFVLLVSLQRG